MGGRWALLSLTRGLPMWWMESPSLGRGSRGDSSGRCTAPWRLQVGGVPLLLLVLLALLLVLQQQQGGGGGLIGQQCRRRLWRRRAHG